MREDDIASFLREGLEFPEKEVADIVAKAMAKLYEAEEIVKEESKKKLPMDFHKLTPLT